MNPFNPCRFFHRQPPWAFGLGGLLCLLSLALLPYNSMAEQATTPLTIKSGAITSEPTHTVLPAKPLGGALPTTSVMAPKVAHPRFYRHNMRPVVKTVVYVPNQVVTLQGTPFVTTQVTFAKDEVIEAVHNGDLGAWTASINPHFADMLFIKPTVYQSDTNMTVVTNKRTYYFHLQSGDDPNALTNDERQGKGQPVRVKPPTYALHFRYPREAMLANLARTKEAKRIHATLVSPFAHPGQYHWDYTFDGDTRLVPEHAFDDGRFTYFELRPEQRVPAVFAVTGKNGAEAIVNTRLQGRYLIVPRTAPQFTLRLGKDQVATVFNQHAIARLRPRGFWG